MTKIKESTMTVDEKKKIQEKLNSLLGIHLVIDGNFGGQNSQTRNAIKKILSYLSRLGVYEGEIDGIWGDMTNAATQLYLDYARNITVRVKDKLVKVRWNLLDSDSITKAFNLLEKYTNKGTLKIPGGRVINFGAKDAAELWMMYIKGQLNYLDLADGGFLNIKNVKTKVKRAIRNSMANSDDQRFRAAALVLDASQQVVPKFDTSNYDENYAHGTFVRNHTPQGTGESSYSDDMPLEKRVFAYLYDKNHQNPVDDEQWGFYVTNSDRKTFGEGVATILGDYVLTGVRDAFTNLGGQIAQHDPMTQNARDAGIDMSFDNTPGKKSQSTTNAFGETKNEGRSSVLGLKLVVTDTKQYSREGAEKLARSYGFETYKYGNKWYQTNWFEGSDYKDESDFLKQIRDKAKENPEEALEMLTKENARQYNTYGNTWNASKNPLFFGTNLLYGNINLGYSASGVYSGLTGDHTVKSPNDPTQSVSRAFSFMNPTYSYDPDSSEGRLGRVDDRTFDRWYSGGYLGELKYLPNSPYRPKRLVPSLYQYGITVPRQNIHQLYVTSSLPDDDDVDWTTTYYVPGQTEQMTPDTWNDFKKNPQGAHEYLSFILGITDKDGNKRRWAPGQKKWRLSKEDKEYATLLANKYGFKQWHKRNDFYGSALFDFMPVHDVYENLQSFYGAAFDDDYNLKPTFSYYENGYNKNLDGGNYRVKIKDGDFKFADDYWNADLLGLDFNMPGGEGGKGIRIINRNKKHADYANIDWSKYKDKYKKGGKLRLIKKKFKL